MALYYKSTSLCSLTFTNGVGTFRAASEDFPSGRMSGSHGPDCVTEGGAEGLGQHMKVSGGGGPCSGQAFACGGEG